MTKDSMPESLISLTIHLFSLCLDHVTSASPKESTSYVKVVNLVNTRLDVKSWFPSKNIALNATSTWTNTFTFNASMN